jgi:hypothetical protein
MLKNRDLKGKRVVLLDGRRSNLESFYIHPRYEEQFRSGQKIVCTVYHIGENKYNKGCYRGAYLKYPDGGLWWAYYLLGPVEGEDYGNG